MTRLCLPVLHREFWHGQARDGLPDTLLDRIRQLLFAPRRWGANLHLRLSELLSEIHSLFGRMKLLREKRHWIAVGPNWEPDPSGHPQTFTRTRARTIDIQEMLANRSWASLADLQIFLEGWDKGEMWASRDGTSDSRCSR
jgi:hypothetical protein